MLFRSAAAQGAGETMTNPPTLLKNYLGAPNPGQSLVAATVGWQFQSGLTETRGWSVSGTAAHMTKRNALVELQAASNFASYRATSAVPFTTAEDNQNAQLMYLEPIRPHFSWLAGAGWRRDAILQLSRRLWGEVGAGGTVVDSKKAYLLLGGSFSLGRERRRAARAASLAGG